MAIFTTQDRDAVKQAIVQAAVDGIASCTVAGQAVTARPLADLQKLLETIQADLALASGGVGLRFYEIVPPGCGGQS